MFLEVGSKEFKIILMKIIIYTSKAVDGSLQEAVERHLFLVFH